MFLTSQKNLLFTAIKEQGFNLREFSLEESTELKVTHTRTAFYFRIYTGPIGTNELRIYGLYTPDFGANIVTQTEVKVHGLKTWPEMIGHVNRWLSWLKTETTQPDLWVEMEHTPYMFADEEPITDGHFTQAEIQQLEERVGEVERRVLALNLHPKAEAAVTAAIRDVPAKARRLTRKDLADCIVGSLVKEGFKWGLTVEHMTAIWHGIQYFFTVYIGPHSPS